jgi:hypothetical protein
MITTFYASFAPICFTLLGLWLVVVQTRHRDWRHSPVHRRRAYSISLGFAFPGLMSLLSLVDPGSQSAWRVAFGMIAAAGLATVVGLWLATYRGGITGASLLAWVTNALTVLIYVVIIAVAIVPDVGQRLGASVSGLQVEAFVLSLLVFLGVNIAFHQVFEESGPDTPVR